MTKARILAKQINAILEVKDVARIGRTAKASDVLKRVRGRIKDPSARLVRNDLLRTTNNRKSLLPSQMGEFRRVKLTVIDAKPDKRTLTFRGKAFGNEVYDVSCSFFGVDFDTKKTDLSPKELPKKLLMNKRIKANFVPTIRRAGHPVRVKCSCPDYDWTWSFANKKAQANSGRILKKVQNYPFQTVPKERQRNEKKIPGLCKHLLVFTQQLANAKFLD